MKQSLPAQPAVPGNEAEGEEMFLVEQRDFLRAGERLLDRAGLCWHGLLPGTGECMGTLLHSSRERGARGLGGSLLDRAALRKLNNWRQLAAIFRVLRKVRFCVKQLPQTLKRELLPTVMTEGLILESRCVRLWSLFKDVLPVNEILLKGSWQLSGPAGSLNLNEIPCVKGKRVSVEIIRIGTLKPKLLELKDFCVFSTVLLCE